MSERKVHEVWETKRIYHFPNGDTVELEHVVEVMVGGSTHRLKTESASGNKRLHIIPHGWIHVEIHAEEWAF